MQTIVNQPINTARDGRRVPLLIGVVAFEKGGSQEGVAFVLDLSERTRAEEELRTGEARFRTFVIHAIGSFSTDQTEPFSI
jgi:PAS domain-containing protein